MRIGESLLDLGHDILTQKPLGQLTPDGRIEQLLDRLAKRPIFPRWAPVSRRPWFVGLEGR
jgi:hypothetical protein